MGAITTTLCILVAVLFLLWVYATLELHSMRQQVIHWQGEAMRQWRGKVRAMAEMQVMQVMKTNWTKESVN